MGFLGRLHRNPGDSSKVGAVCVDALLRICAEGDQPQLVFRRIARSEAILRPKLRYLRLFDEK